MTDNERVTLVPTSSMSFDNQVLIARAYVVLTNNGETPIHYKTVMKRTGLARTQISGVNSFFVSLGVLESVSKGMYTPRKCLVEFVGERPGDEDYSKLTDTLRNSALYHFIRGLIRIHGQVTKSDAINQLLSESGEKTLSRAERSLQWLDRVGLIVTNQDGDIQIRENGGLQH